MPLDAPVIRRQFRIFDQTVNGRPLTYLDSAATAQKPDCVLQAMDRYYTHDHGNVNRGVHVLAERATDAYERARGVVQAFVGARASHEIIFTRNATESINLVAKTWGKAHLGEGDAIVLSQLEHHSNIVPWQQLSLERGCSLKWLSVDRGGSMDPAELSDLLKDHSVKLVAISAVSNVLGTRAPLSAIIALAHQAGALVLIDAAQMAPRERIDVQSLDCDFLAFSGHKVYGPTGIGVLYGKAALLDSMPPFLGGGDMIQLVEQDRFTPAELPRKFEAGTPAIAEAVGLAAALTWVESLGFPAIQQHERQLLRRALAGLSALDQLTILGPASAEDRVGCISFTIDNVHPHDLTQLLSDSGICLRAGHHCTQPLHRVLGIAASTRLSLGVYNTEEEIEASIGAIEEASRTLR